LKKHPQILNINDHSKIYEGKQFLILLKENLANAKSHIKTIRRIPKGARYSAAVKLCTIIKECLDSNSITAWSNLLLFSYKVFNISEKSLKKSLTSVLKENVINFNLQENGKKKINKPSLSKIIEAKMNDFDVKGSVRLLSSNDTLATFDDETLEILKSKHPQPSRKLIFPNINLTDCQILNVNEIEVKKAINSFPCGSAAGIDGFRPQFLKDMISVSAGEAGQRALSSITLLCNFLLSGKIINEMCPFIFGASLCALKKKDGGIRPIAIGNIFRRLAAKIGCYKLQSDLHSYLTPNQLGVATKLGCESCIHSVRTYVHNPENVGKILLKIDFSNAFNSIERDSMLQQVKDKTPSLFPFLNQCYREPSHLFFGNYIIPSVVGCQQGDPCGPMAFSLTVHPIVESITTELNVWYLDDATIADVPDIVFENFKRIINTAKEVGLHINPNKCELFFCSDTVDEDVLRKFKSLTSEILVVNKNNLELLGSPIFEDGFDFIAKKKIEKVFLLLKNIEQENLNSHTAYFWVTNCLFVPRLIFLLRTSPFWKFPNCIKSIDNAIRNSLQKFLNIKFNENQWTLASLPISNGGLGIRKIQDISMPAFLGSIHGVHDLVFQILPKTDKKVSVHFAEEAIGLWIELNDKTFPTETFLQKGWDIINTTRIIVNKINLCDKIGSARFLAAQRKESNAWLHAFPSRNIGPFMDNKILQICVANRFGVEIFEKHTCHCGFTVSNDGRHGLSCAKNKGRFSRHSDLNQIIQRALSSIHISSSLETCGL
jgi:hypothetical protein